MRSRIFTIVTATALLTALAAPALAAQVNVDAGRKLFTQSCISCHATSAATAATDGAPPLSYIARDNKKNPAGIRGWLMDPHPPMPGIMLSRQQVDDIIAYLNSIPAE